MGVWEYGSVGVEASHTPTLLLSRTPILPLPHTSSAMTLISELIDLPERVHRGDFVLNLSDGVRRPTETLKDYVVTPQLVSCFDNALGFIRSAVEGRSSKAAYLHGSFGSGKSHFMAVLHLLLHGNAEARAIPELSDVVVEHEWVSGKKFLLVPYHMIGARNMESAILGRYADYVKQEVPGAPVPGVYLAEDLFEDARRFRSDLGDEKFFERLNAGAGGGAGKWGKMSQGWTAESFQTAVGATPNHADRIRLIGDLVRNLFTGYQNVAQGNREAFVSLDQGLSVMSQHAAALGYDALILFLDELILWLASHAGDMQFVHQEGQKLAKLVESQTPDRPVPVVSFVARQRDLRELVGDNVTGVEQLNFSDALKHWEERFHRIVLEDRNLPAIAGKRVLRPRDTACKTQIDDAFEKHRFKQEVMDTLLTSEADRKMFRLVYPFSPALVQALVALSSALQRQRTALKIMMQLLVDQRESLQLGDIIPVGDLWEQVTGEVEPLNEALQIQVENAKKLYHQKLRPMLEEIHEVNEDMAAKSRKRRKDGGEEDREIENRLRAFENDDRLVKTLLMAALVPDLECFRNLTASKLAALNYGTIKSPIPGREGQIVLGKVRALATRVGEIRVEEGSSNPTISVKLSGVDTEAIIEAAKHYDRPGNRVRRTREMAFESMGIPLEENLTNTYARAFQWRGSRRECDVVFANVRELPDESLRNSGDDWKVVLDFPFDQEGHSVTEDLVRLERYQDEQEPLKTLVWLTPFFSRETQNDLGKLVVIEELLKGDNLRQHSQNLSSQERATAKGLLENQQSSLRTRLHHALEAAYGIREPGPNMLDDADELKDRQFTSLLSGFQPQAPVGANLKAALEHLLDQALSNQFPGHPRFEKEEVRVPDLRRVWDVTRQAIQEKDGRVMVDRPLRQVMRQIANPLELGNMTEAHFILSDDWRKRFDRQLAAAGKENPSVDDLRAWMDVPQARGVLPEVGNLLILTYAEQTNRSFFLHSGPYEASLESLEDAVELRIVALPTPEEWKKAVDLAGAVFGLTMFQMLNAGNVARLSEQVQEKVREYRGDCGALPDKVKDSMARVGYRDTEIEGCDRYKTAAATARLLEDLEGKDSTPTIRCLANATEETSAAAMGTSLKSVKQVLGVLRNTKWQLFQAVQELTGDREEEAGKLLENVRGALAHDEYVEALSDAMERAERLAIDLLTPPKKAPTPPTKPPTPKPPIGGGWKVVDQGSDEKLDRAGWVELSETVRKQLDENADRRVSVNWEIREKEEE